MDMEFKEKFIAKWNRYFGKADLPIVFYYTDEEVRAEMVPTPSGQVCVIGVLVKVRNGKSLYFGADSIGCGGGKRYLGFSDELIEGFEYFLSYGIKGQMEGERYKKTPEIVKKMMRDMPPFKAPARFIVFKRWDKLVKEDKPEVVIFFAKPDVMSGLFTLSGFEEVNPYQVIAPFAAGCGSIVLHPYLERDKPQQRCVIGMFDVSARPYVPRNRLTFAIPVEKFRRMIDDMDESFLITQSWDKVKKRI